MKKSGLLNPDLNRAVARLGHTDTFVIADCGLPIPTHVPIVDLSLVFGIPRFADVVNALLTEVVTEGFTLAAEAGTDMRESFGRRGQVRIVPHEDLKKLVGEACFVVRTGETTPYSNVIVHCGVPF
ncbi:D-ribose pyranase [Trueperella pyogenes]|uniref:D-ribose pyranase n=1 Tax=Trueperella pyogenes TaxID=1661 RepID=UPI000D52E090|nr:D-ribose pyranase [Trueperella pyogenes]AWG03325.1 D-ribose pyranase [Trueperella pyogenes]UVJ54078.1 D-ribose pyranase [Trueperella pyogenes]UVJ56060.1 D-ribose pyranase [Trueperella pyogenes]UVJ58097.1 D-ribose pyranase [Trueperella pyogenes]UVJ60100.1 D-ribose pyranase [Trueperella pyogenes]